MDMNKTFICLANSRKVSGRCVAGKEFSNNIIGRWIRPISEREHHEISELDRRYENGTMPKVFDIIGIELKAKSIHQAQEENYLIDDDYYWVYQGQYSGSIDALLDHPASLWENGHHSYSGVNDRVPVTLVIQPIQSLYFIAPTNMTIVVQTEGAAFGNAKKKIRAEFTYNGQRHFISITDPEVERIYLALGEGRYEPTGKIYMTVSLGEAWDGHYYKLAAGVFEVRQ